MDATTEHKREALAAIFTARCGNSCAVQCARIRAALSRFSLTTFEAIRHPDVYDPKARVLQLRKEGEPIKTTWGQIATEYEHLHRVGVLCAGNRGCAVNISSGVHLTEKDRTRLYVCARQMQTIQGASA